MKISTGMWAVLVMLAASGCHSMGHNIVIPPHEGPARELNKAILPPYIIEPPDILVVEALSATPRGLYSLRSGDVIALTVSGTLPDEPLQGLFRIERGGVVILGGSYGSVKISGMTASQAEQVITEHLKQRLRAPGVSITLAETAGLQQITGEHLVAQDGTITLGTYGSVLVVGMTIAQAKLAIEAHLSTYFEQPEVSVDVFAYNSKVYYVITQGAGLGDGVYRFPITGNETVIDAVAQISGYDQTSSCKMWVARPAHDRLSQHDVMPVDWCGITKLGDVTTNYQLMPGDRVYVAEDKWVAIDTKIGKITSPFERLFGFSTLGVDTVTRFSGPVLKGGGARFNNAGAVIINNP